MAYQVKGIAHPAIQPLHLLWHQSQTHADLTMNKLQFKGEWHELKGTLNWLTLPRRLVMLNYAFTFLLLP